MITGTALLNNSKAQVDNGAEVPELKNQTKKQHRALPVFQGNKWTIIRTRKLAGSMAAAAKHLSVQLTAPEQPFHATTATESVPAGSTRDRTDQSSQGGSAKHRTLAQGTHQQITDHKPPKTTASERRVKPEISNCSITLHVLYGYITLLYGTLRCVV